MIKINFPYSGFCTLLSVIFIGLSACSENPVPEVIQLDPAEAVRLSDKSGELVSAQVKEGLEMTVWATDTLVQDPTAISIDNQGNVYYVRAQRLRNSEFDIRGHRDWMTASISFQHVEDRRKFLRDTFATSRSHLNTSLPDLNKDSIHDWRDLTVEKEEVWKVTDQDNDGVGDRAQLFIRDFHEEITDLANGLHAEENQVFLAVGPDLWRIEDKNGDGISDAKESISHGFAVHIGFGAHGMSGVTRGPDGRIWWGIGDIGMNVIDKSGKNWKYPNQGVIVRCEPDGSNFEVYAAGLRNTHEFVFDQYGNLITEDNDGDHPGERERLVYVTNGSDGGWRINWQFGKYTDPKNNSYKVWMDERMNVPRWEGQAAYITPPIVNYVNGPTGMVYNPGTALSESYKDHFFIVEFRGTPANSPIHAFTMEPDGASFKLNTTEKVVSGLLPAGLAFGPDGALYFSDWIEGWGVKDQGRIWKLDVPGEASSAIRMETKELLAASFKKSTADDLSTWLGHADMRVRSKAQFELATRGKMGYEVFQAAAGDQNAQMKRIHGLWGIAQMSRKDIKYASALSEYLSDSDPEIQAQAAKMIGDVRYKDAGPALVGLLDHESLRVQFFAAEAIGRTQYEDGLMPVMEMLVRNDDKDAWLRHAGVLAMARLGRTDPLIALANHSSRALRTAAVVALRRLQAPGIAIFLKDKDEYIVTEAARAINDDFSIEAALPDLARVLNEERFTNEALIRRAINANSRIGGEVAFQNLVNYAKRKNAPTELRVEALATLANWKSPSVLDRVDGRYRGPVTRDAPVQLLVKDIDQLLGDSQAEIQVAAIGTLSPLGITRVDQLAGMFRNSPSSIVRTEALKALASADFEGMSEMLELALKDNTSAVRSAALRILPSSKIDPQTIVGLLESVISSGDTREKQAAIETLGTIKADDATAAIGSLASQLINGELEADIHLEVLEAVAAQNSPETQQMVADYLSQSGTEDPLAAYRATLAGGDLNDGRRIFYRHQGAQCVRCHTVFEFGGDAGPVLADVGSRLSREQLLESMILPNAQIAAGYESISIFTKSEDTYSGIVRNETPEDIQLLQGDLSLVTIPKSEIVDRLNAASSMPGVTDILTKKEIRNLIEFLANLKGHTD